MTEKLHDLPDDLTISGSTSILKNNLLLSPEQQPVEWMIFKVSKFSDAEKLVLDTCILIFKAVENFLLTPKNRRHVRREMEFSCFEDVLPLLEEVYRKRSLRSKLDVIDSEKAI